MNQTNYSRLDWKWRHHHQRYKNFIENHGLVCQECGGGGELLYDRFDWYNLYEVCGWCEGTGKVTRWRRGAWLRLKKLEKKTMADMAQEYISRQMFSCRLWRLTLTPRGCMGAQQRPDMSELACWQCSWGKALRKKHGVTLRRLEWQWTRGAMRAVNE